MVNPTSEQLHWNQLRKQHLLEEKVSDFYEVTKVHLGLHSTDYWTPYFSIWARLGNFDAQRMFESLNNGNKLARSRAFRTTVHVMHLDNLSLILSATGPSLFHATRTNKYTKVDRLSDLEIEDMLDRVREVLDKGPLQTSELKKAVPEVGEYMRSALIMLMARGEVIRAQAKHARSNLTSYALIERWFKNYKFKPIDENKAITELIKRHIERFGPVSVEDIAWWLRQTKTTIASAIQNIGDEIVRVNLENSEKFMSREDYEIASGIEITSQDQVWFLPYEDHFLKAIIDRGTFINQDIQPKLFPADRQHYWPSNPDAPRKMPSRGLRATGEVRPSIWLNGRAIGRWELDDDEDQKKVVTSLYEKVNKSQLERINEARSNLEDFVNLALLPISKG